MNIALWFTRFGKGRPSPDEIKHWYESTAAGRHAAILDSLNALHRKVDQMARTEQELSDDLDKIAAGVAAAVQEVADLKAQIAALGTTITQDQLDALTAKADGIVTSLSALAPPPATV